MHLFERLAVAEHGVPVDGTRIDAVDARRHRIADRQHETVSARTRTSRAPDGCNEGGTVTLLQKEPA